MIRYWITILALSVVTLAAQTQYRIDILGDRYQCRTIYMPNDHDGRGLYLNKEAANGRNPTRPCCIFTVMMIISSRRSLAIASWLMATISMRWTLENTVAPFCLIRIPFFCKVSMITLPTSTRRLPWCKARNSRILLMAHSHRRTDLHRFICAASRSMPRVWRRWYWIVRFSNGTSAGSWKIVMPVVSFIGKFFKSGCWQFKRCDLFRTVFEKAHGEWEYDTTKENGIRTSEESQVGFIR